MKTTPLTVLITAWMGITAKAAPSLMMPLFWIWFAKVRRVKRAEKWRDAGIRTPVLILTARDSWHEK